MRILLFFSAVYIYVYTCFLMMLGMAFYGFRLVPFIGGISAMLAVVVGCRAYIYQHRTSLFGTVFLCAIALLCMAIEVADYYVHHARPGNYFAWELHGPFVIALLVIGLQAIKTQRSTSP